MVFMYDTNIIHHAPPWNIPPAPKYADGQRVKTLNGEIGVVSFVLPSPPTSSMRARESAYGVRVGINDPIILFESSLTPIEP